MIEDSELQPGQPRLLTVDNEIVVPVDKVIKVLITANDVLMLGHYHRLVLKEMQCLVELMKHGSKLIELEHFMGSVQNFVV